VTYSPDRHRFPLMEFHVSRHARDRYQFDASLFALNGGVIFADFHAARVFAHRMNEKRDLVRFPEQAVRAGQLNAMGLIDEIMHHVVDVYRRQMQPEVMRQALDRLNQEFGRERVDQALLKFADEFPPLAVYRREVDASAYLNGETAGVPNRLLALEEMLMLWLANVNPATAPFLELFDDTGLEKETVYPRLMSSLREFFDAQPVFGPDRQSLIDMLRSPALAVPHSLPGQLEYILTRWGLLLGKYLYRLLGGLDFALDSGEIRGEGSHVAAGGGLFLLQLTKLDGQLLRRLLLLPGQIGGDLPCALQLALGHAQAFLRYKFLREFFLHAQHGRLPFVTEKFKEQVL